MPHIIELLSREFLGTQGKIMTRLLDALKDCHTTRGSSDYPTRESSQETAPTQESPSRFVPPDSGPFSGISAPVTTPGLG